MLHFAEYNSNEWAELAEAGIEVFLPHEDADGGAIHGVIGALRTTEDGIEVVDVWRIGKRSSYAETLRVGLIGQWFAQAI